MVERFDEILELRELFRRGDAMSAVHYVCENLYTAKDHPAAVSCIAFSPIGRGNATSFSLVDVPAGTSPEDAEITVLSRYFEHVEQHVSTVFVHWNMRNADFGFAALESRYLHLTGQRAYRVPSDRTYDLDELISNEFGSEFAPHPCLIGSAAMNGLRRRHALAGADEAERFSSGDHGSIRRSTDEKVHWIATLAELFLVGGLKTSNSVGSVDSLREIWTQFEPSSRSVRESEVSNASWLAVIPIERRSKWRTSTTLKTSLGRCCGSSSTTFDAKTMCLLTREPRHVSTSYFPNFNLPSS